MRRPFVCRTDFRSRFEKRFAEIRNTPFESLYPVGKETYDLVEIADGLVLVGHSSFELDDSLFHLEILSAQG
jgi:hypothetical protein